jgi:hypothetical protein
MSRNLLLLVRWTARASAVFLAGMYLFLVAGEFISPHSNPPTRLREWAGIALFTTGCLAPVLAWPWGLRFAFVSLASLALFIPVVQMHDYGVVAVAAVPAALLLLDGVLWRLSAPAK